MNGTRKEPTARAKERAALPAGKEQRERGTFVRIIGDAKRPSNITNAVYEGFHAALDI